MQVPLTPVRCLYRAVDLYGKKVGVVSGPCRFTYAQFGERCERLAAGLQHLGVVPGDRVAYLSFNNHQLLEGYFGVPMIRAMVMPLNVRLTPAELTGILCHAEPRVLLYESDFAPLVAQLREACPAVEHWIEIAQPYEDLLSHGRLPRPDIFSFDENEIAELFYTSGSTGTPKGVMLSHRGLYLHTLYVTGVFYHDDNAVELHTIPLFHANGWGRPQSATMMGLKQVMVRRFDPPQVLRLIEEERATSMSMVPTMAVAMLNCAELGRQDASSMRDVMLGGAAASPELVARLEQAFPTARVVAGYGMTETSPVATSARDKSTVPLDTDEERQRRRASTGWPLPGCEVRVSIRTCATCRETCRRSAKS
jgi:fatty-acyl-CoA synthase